MVVGETHHFRVHTHMAIFTQCGGGGGGDRWRFSHQQKKMGPSSAPASTAPSTFLWPLPPEHPGGECDPSKHEFPTRIVTVQPGVGLSRWWFDWFSKEFVFYTYKFGFKASHICWPYTWKKGMVFENLQTPFRIGTSRVSTCQHPAGPFTQNGETIRGIWVFPKIMVPPNHPF